ncbi:MarR family winged helix-turn-helix transcriptional regulator [Acetivibrio thermocellus]|jgi:DNA-binding MarR family transcriptional regulator|uniref:MarR family winged helix-turn-helix transcriptional regulator n=1 Tax=Acetivibrio thermocellus TaxID=1515 RepID=UPI000038FA94|nr:MarR family transcriptional regulator [Acetivibrio thermocellus]UWV47717.1 MarR family transcriptional regulator [Acetivibrio thermocellus]
MRLNKSIGRLINLLARKSQMYLGKVLSQYNLTAAEEPFFMALQNREGITQEELTSIVCVDKAATARAVRSLEEKGYLLRIQDEKDKRQNRVYPTEKAKQIGQEVRTELMKFNKLLTRNIKEEDLDRLYSLLLQMEENMNKIFKEMIYQGNEEQE